MLQENCFLDAAGKLHIWTHGNESAWTRHARAEVKSGEGHRKKRESVFFKEVTLVDWLFSTDGDHISKNVNVTQTILGEFFKKSTWTQVGLEIGEGSGRSMWGGEYNQNTLQKILKELIKIRKEKKVILPKAVSCFPGREELRGSNIHTKKQCKTAAVASPFMTWSSTLDRLLAFRVNFALLSEEAGLTQSMWLSRGWLSEELLFFKTFFLLLT